MNEMTFKIHPSSRGTDDQAIPQIVPEPKILGIAVKAWPDILLPIAAGMLFLGLWEAVVRLNDIPTYILPGPILISQTLWEDGPSLLVSLGTTLRISLSALLAAVVVGGGLAILFTQSRLIERSLLPYAVVLQVTPVVALAPLIIIYVGDVNTSLLICAWLVAFFPILSNTTIGLNSADHNLINLYEIYGASRWQTLRYLKLPSALPYFLAGLRISGGLALIGGVVAEFVAGSGGSASGLAFRILEASYQLKIPRMFAAVVIISVTGVVIFLITNLVSHLLLHRWHESAVRREN